ncbi:MAG: hypothetical protein V1743_07695 [Nanoarchaeota archaeon]
MAKNKKREEKTDKERTEGKEEKPEGPGQFKSQGDKDQVYQLFGLSIVKQIDQKTRQVHLEIKSKVEGLPIAEAILLVEGWLQAEKEKLIGPVFHPKKDVNP